MPIVATETRTFKRYKTCSYCSAQFWYMNTQTAEGSSKWSSETAASRANYNARKRVVTRHSDVRCPSCLKLDSKVALLRKLGYKSSLFVCGLLLIGLAIAFFLIEESTFVEVPRILCLIAESVFLLVWGVQVWRYNPQARRRSGDQIGNLDMLPGQQDSNTTTRRR
jgi:hypothetical protein